MRKQFVLRDSSSGVAWIYLKDSALWLCKADMERVFELAARDEHWRERWVLLTISDERKDEGFRWAIPSTTPNKLVIESDDPEFPLIVELCTVTAGFFCRLFMLGWQEIPKMYVGVTLITEEEGMDFEHSNSLYGDDQ